MAVEIAVLHLHELRDDRAVGEELDLAREEHEFLARASRRDGDLLLDRRKALVEPDAVEDAAPVGKEGRIHRGPGRAEDLLVERPHVRGIERAGFVVGGDAAGV